MLFSVKYFLKIQGKTYRPVPCYYNRGFSLCLEKVGNFEDVGSIPTEQISKTIIYLVLHTRFVRHRATPHTLTF